MTVDILALIADDETRISYHPRWNRFTGSVNATILLRQVILWWVKKGRQPFYKFSAPCSHTSYRPGDSWQEEIGFSRRELETARGKIAAKTMGQLDPARLVSYWHDKSSNMIWYALNETAVLNLLAKLYPQTDGVVGIQGELPGTNGGNVHSEWRNQPLPMAESAITNGGNVHSEWRNQPLPMAESDITNGGIRHSLNTTLTQSTTTTLTSTDTTTSTTTAADIVDAILDWMKFDDVLRAEERIPAAELLAWAFWVKLEGAKIVERGGNPVGIARASWRRKPERKKPRKELLELAEAWLAMGDDDRSVVLDACYNMRGNRRIYLPDDFAHYLPFGPLKALYRELDGDIAPPALMPPEVEEEVEE